MHIYECVIYYATPHESDSMQAVVEDLQMPDKSRYLWNIYHLQENK
jgi:hypothetical protein